MDGEEWMMGGVRGRVCSFEEIENEIERWVWVFGCEVFSSLYMVWAGGRWIVESKAKEGRSRGMWKFLGAAYPFSSHFPEHGR